jgi:3-hydroxybutyryl-CoA dehydrogenase
MMDRPSDSPDPPGLVGIIGAGRMGRGIALCFAMAGVPSFLVDLKEREKADRAALEADVRRELAGDLEFLASLGLLSRRGIEPMLGLVRFMEPGEARGGLARCALVFEAVPEVMALKESCLRWISEHGAPEAIIASTTSTFLVDDLARFVTGPGRFVNAHWLNPAHLMPLVEVSQGAATCEDTMSRLIGMLEAIGKIPARLGASAGYIVPRIQALAMNEAARMVEEGVATAAEIDKAVRVGFGVRFAVLGLLEFTDWGGGDILYYASNYLSKMVDKERFQVPDVVARNMSEGRNGLRDGKGFYDFSNMDIEAYRRDRLKNFVRLLQHLDLLPRRRSG